MMKLEDFVNPFKVPGKWYKANLHTHTTTSDGVFSPAEEVQRYADAGYDVLVLTDHSKTNDISEFSGREDILVVSGMECHPVCPGRGRFHIVAVHVPADFFYDEDNAAKCVAQIGQVGGASVLAHPFWTGHDLREMVTVCGCDALEVYNGSADPYDRAESSSEWSMCLEKGYYFGGVAVDDTHMKDMRDFFMGWTCLKMEELTVENIVAAIKAGSYYASCGPEIKDFGIEDDCLTLKCSSVEKIIFTGFSQGQGCRIWAPAGDSVVQASIPVADIKSWPFVRGVVIDHKGKKAWTNPIIV